MSRAYYNDNDPFCCRWLQRLIEAGAIAPGTVDCRSIVDVRAQELEGYDQHHFFAGIGGWSAAVRLAGWPDGRACWTASLPCQPLSGLGEQRGHVDQRHLWPAFHALISECRPATIFGEQVASPDGREWLAGIRADLERIGYAVGAACLPAASAGSPTKRERLFFVGNAGSARLERHAGHGDDGDQSRRLDEKSHRPVAPPGAPRPLDFWRNFDIAHLTDGTQRRIEPGTLPMADGIPDRMGRLRGYGNAIVPQLAAEFIAAWVDVAEPVPPPLTLICGCGYSFPAKLGKYGCPNCEGADA
jgi:DNA (cytosine-5)-methyltransferase 1